MTELLVADRSGLDFQLVVHVSGVRTPIRNFTDEAFLLGSVDRPAQGDLSINGDDLHILSVNGHGFLSDNFFANLRRGGHVSLAVALIKRRQRLLLAVANIYPGIVNVVRRVGGEVRLNLVSAINVPGGAGLTKVRPLVGFEMRRGSQRFLRSVKLEGFPSRIESERGGRNSAQLVAA